MSSPSASSHRPRLAIIGASGFIGLRATEILGADPNFIVVPVVRSPSSLAVLARQPLDWRITSFLDATALDQALRNCTVCIHAAIGDATQIMRMAEVTYRACAAAGVRRLIWLSSASVHGQNCAPGTDESTPLHDHHPLTYNNAKVRAEWTLQKLERDGRVEVVRLRPAIVFGPRSRWIADAAGEIRQGRAAWLNGGRGICNSLYVDNLVEAIRLAVVAARAPGEAFLLGDAETVTWRDFLLPIATHLGADDSAFADLPFPPVVPERANRLAALTLSPLYRRAGDLIPSRIKRLVKGMKRVWPEPSPAASAWTLRSSHVAPRLTLEHALLQQCEWKLPHARAAERLGYAPRISFAEGMRRSLAWLDFSEGREASPLALPATGLASR